MSKISERLEAYQNQMSIYAEQHKVILASDVLDMIEQLQDDLKDTIEKVVEEIKEATFGVDVTYTDSEGVVESEEAIRIIRKGGVE